MNADYTPMTWSYVIGAVGFAGALIFGGWVTVLARTKWAEFRRWQNERDDFIRWEFEQATTRTEIR